MKFIFFLSICFGFLSSFAQINPMEYFYQGRCEVPDFAALAVLERQNCPHPVTKYKMFSREHERYRVQICISSYRILRVLDAASNILRKEYLEAIEIPVYPYYRHRPMLIFGKKNENGMIYIQGREEMSEYFENPNSREMDIRFQSREFSNFLADSRDIHAFHSIGTPYYNIGNFDRIDTMYYADYLLPRMKFEVEAAGKNFSELLLRLSYKRTPVRATKIKNDFAALGTIKSVHPAGEPGQQKFNELRLAIETLIKNDAKISSKTAIYMDKARLPSDWLCWPEGSFRREKPFYFFGDLKNGVLVIDSLVSTRDAFAFNDTIYDISMGISFEELISYFLPLNISLEELKFGNCWADFYDFPKIRDGIIPNSLVSKPDSLVKAVSEIAMKWAFIDNKYEQRWETFRKEYNDYPGDPFLFSFYYDKFRCRGDSHPQFDLIQQCEHCKVRLEPKDYGIWGRKW